MKAVMISIQPKWCELIASGKKTIEVRKTKPKIDTPFKCYIYKTKQRRLRAVLDKGEEYYGQKVIKTEVISCPDIYGGKVIGEFTCSKIDKIINRGYDYCIDGDNAYTNKIAKQSCLEIEDINRYLGVKTHGYAWHISDLIIYDKPKGLREFLKKEYCKYYDGGCNCCYELCERARLNDCRGGRIRLTRPPQSWQYVEELK